MTRNIALLILALAFTAGAGAVNHAAAQVRYPRIPLWAYPGAYQDSSLISPRRCVGSFQGPLADSVRKQPRTISVRFLRDRQAEARPDFGGYRIYRVIDAPDTSRMVLIRRFSRQPNPLGLLTDINWNFSVLDTSDMQYKCNGRVANDSIVTFVDPDSNGNFVKVCRRVDNNGRCLTPGDSLFKLVAPAGPHDGFLTWYSITYEEKNTTDNNYEDAFVADTTGIIGPCTNPANRSTCPNLNNKVMNIIPKPVEPTGGPGLNLGLVSVVPNPYRATEAWDRPGAHELHFINLPTRATIKIYTVAGDLVAQLTHNDTVRDFERWDLKNSNGHEIASGIYMYRVVSDRFTFQNRFIVIR